jgi:hypothetical protein
VNELFHRTGKISADIIHAGGRTEWFDRSALD